MISPGKKTPPPAAPNDREATAQLLLETHGAALGRVCMALLGSQGEAERALKETLVEALDALPSLPQDGELRAWLSSIARRRCARRAAARPVTVAGVSSDPADRPRLARGLLLQLRPTEREALVLRFGAGLELNEVAEACGVDEATASQRLSRGLSRLRGRMSEEQS